VVLTGAGRGAVGCALAGLRRETAHSWRYRAVKLRIQVVPGWLGGRSFRGEVLVTAVWLSGQ
jgi:hypothetical protein